MSVGNDNKYGSETNFKGESLRVREELLDICFSNEHFLI